MAAFGGRDGFHGTESASCIAMGMIKNMIDQGKLRAESRALALLGPKFNKAGAPPADPRWRRVTVAELLQHRGGWDRNQSFDQCMADETGAAEHGNFHGRALH